MAELLQKSTCSHLHILFITRNPAIFMALGKMADGPWDCLKIMRRTLALPDGENIL
jgi:hypothetical protein